MIDQHEIDLASQEESRALIQDILDNTVAAAPNDLAHKLFAHFCLDFRLPRSIRLHPRLNYRLGTQEVFGQYPALVIPLVDGWGNYSALEIFFFGEDGRAAPILQPWHIYWPMGVIKGLHMPVHPSVDGLYGVAVGLGEALAAHHFSGVPMCAVSSASDLAELQIPDGLSALHIFASHKCLSEAEHLKRRAARAGLEVDISLPPTDGVDWVTEFAFRGAVPIDDIATAKDLGNDDSRE